MEDATVHFQLKSTLHLLFYLIINKHCSTAGMFTLGAQLLLASAWFDIPAWQLWVGGFKLVVRPESIPLLSILI
ncbi:hypothetical protein SAMN02745866_00859 [Alteromonadaceae bacterium Bs31]|nr:hypothetical protein SAMN02745866_00859 [Alteromonadaceae bacterium Bs31]